MAWCEFKDEQVSAHALYNYLISLVLLVLLICMCAQSAAAQGCGHWEERVPGFVTGAPAAYDSARAVMVLFENAPGGRTETGKTWEYAGSGWRFIPSSGPAPQKGEVMAYDSARGVMVLYGDGQLWEWDGAAWAQRTPSGPEVPPDCTGRSMAYDAARGVSVFYGGLCEEGTTYDTDTWAWDGTSCFASTSHSR